MRNIVTLAAVAGIIWFAQAKRNHPEADKPQSLPALSELQVERPAKKAATSFTCDGRTHCSQMTSCAEATYFIQHCPGTKMDGDNDGVPCESQLCN